MEGWQVVDTLVMGGFFFGVVIISFLIALSGWWLRGYVEHQKRPCIHARMAPRSEQWVKKPSNRHIIALVVPRRRVSWDEIYEEEEE